MDFSGLKVWGLDFFVTDCGEKNFMGGDFLVCVHGRWYGAWGREKVPRRKRKATRTSSI